MTDLLWIQNLPDLGQLQGCILVGSIDGSARTTSAIPDFFMKKQDGKIYRMKFARIRVKEKNELAAG
jgi:hypothetical protein